MIGRFAGNRSFGDALLAKRRKELKQQNEANQTQLQRRSVRLPQHIIKVAASSEVDYCFFAHELRENRNGSGSFCFLLL
jgi:hypothetical protein